MVTTCFLRDVLGLITNWSKVFQKNIIALIRCKQCWKQHERTSWWPFGKRMSDMETYDCEHRETRVEDFKIINTPC